MNIQLTLFQSFSFSVTSFQRKKLYVKLPVFLFFLLVTLSLASSIVSSASRFRFFFFLLLTFSSLDHEQIVNSCYDNKILG